MTDKLTVFEEVEGLYKIIPLQPFRHTPGVSFDCVPMDLLAHIDGIDRVIHHQGAISPGPVEGIERPWYMHEYQEDYLIVLYGSRLTDVYSQTHGRVENFEVAPHYIKKNGKVIFEGAAMLTWPTRVFHRIISCEETGSASLNFAVRRDGFDIDTNFSIYDLDVQTGSYRVIREGHLDQT